MRLNVSEEETRIMKALNEWCRANDPLEGAPPEEILEPIEKSLGTYTCRDCKPTRCPFRWDPYNTNGDCLTEK